MTLPNKTFLNTFKEVFRKPRELVKTKMTFIDNGSRSEITTRVIKDAWKGKKDRPLYIRGSACTLVDRCWAVAIAARVIADTRDATELEKEIIIIATNRITANIVRSTLSMYTAPDKINVLVWEPRGKLDLIDRLQGLQKDSNPYAICVMQASQYYNVDARALDKWAYDSNIPIVIDTSLPQMQGGLPTTTRHKYACAREDAAISLEYQLGFPSNIILIRDKN